MEDPEDRHGSRQWFVRNAVKVTMANSVERGCKAVDAVQLVGE